MWCEQLQLRLTNLSTYFPSILFPTCRSRYQVSIHSVMTSIAFSSLIHLALFRRPILISLHICLASPSFLLSLWPKCDSFRNCFATNASNKLGGAFCWPCKCSLNSCSPRRSRNYFPHYNLKTHFLFLLWNSLIISMTTYSSAPWTLTKAQKKRIDAFYTKALRRSAGVRCYVTNAPILTPAQDKPH